VQRPAEREVLRPALELVVLGRPELVVKELELHHLAGEVLDRADLVEQLPQALVHEPGERIELQLDEVRDGQSLVDPGVGDPARRGQGACRRLSSRQHETSLLGEGGKGEKGPRSQNKKGYRAIPKCQTGSAACGARPEARGVRRGITAPEPLPGYLISTFAPCSSRAALIFSASSRVTPSLTGLGNASTTSLASLRPSPV